MTSAAPSITAIGGGHGLAATLGALRLLTPEVTAIVSIADDGGSSGRLRAELGIAPPGDLRKAIVALSDPASVLARALVERFEGGALEGHAFGNLLIAAMAGVEGDLVPAIEEVMRLVGAVGRVVPATTGAVTLRALTRSGSVVEGQVAVMGTDDLCRVSTVPEDPEVPKEALDAIATSDAIVLGPGSLFTSVLAAAATPGIVGALAGRNAPLIYVCNLRQQMPETGGIDAAGHLEVVRRHGIEPDVVIYDPRTIDGTGLGSIGFAASVSRGSGLAHDPRRLAATLASLACWPVALEG